MHNYESIRREFSSEVDQTLDSPIMVFDFWELSDVFIALFVILVFGILFYSWGTMFLLLVLILGVGPVVKRRHNRGIYMHLPFRHLGMSLPGLMNSRGKRKFSN